jgi:hypothetical protein
VYVLVVVIHLRNRGAISGIATDYAEVESTQRERIKGEQERIPKMARLYLKMVGGIGIMPYLDKQDYEERFGETVGFCNTHKVQIVDSNCERCEDEMAEVECNACEEKKMNIYRIYWSRTTKDTGQEIRNATDKKSAELDARLHADTWKRSEHDWDFTAHAVLICPECEGENLTPTGHICFDCQAEDYTEEKSDE